MYLIIYYVFKKSSKILDKEDRNTWIYLRLKPLVFIGVLFNFFETVMLLIGYNTDTGEDFTNVLTKTCRSPIWLSSAAFQFLVVLVFICFVTELNNKLKR